MPVSCPYSLPGQSKAQALPALRVWLAAGCAFEVWSWAKRKGRWCCRRQALTPADLLAVG